MAGMLLVGEMKRESHQGTATYAKMRFYYHLHACTTRITTCFFILNYYHG